MVLAPCSRSLWQTAGCLAAAAALASLLSCAAPATEKVGEEASEAVRPTAETVSVSASVAMEELAGADWNLGELAEFIREGGTEPGQLDTILDSGTGPPVSSPLWPVYAYLKAEALRVSGRSDEARATFRELAKWGASDPVGDSWGGSSLSFLGLWRWVQALEADSAVDADEVDEILELDQPLRQDARLVRGLFRFGFLDILPQLEEDFVRRLALLSWEVGRQEEAQALFVDFLTLTPPGDLEPEEQELFDGIIARGWASRDRLNTLRAERFEDLREYDAAAELWTELLDSGDAWDRANAGLQLAKLHGRLSSASRTEIAGMLDRVLLDAKGPEMIQEAMLERAKTWAHAGTGMDLAKYETGLLDLIEAYPTGPYTDDALYLLAVRHWRIYENTSDVEEIESALRYFADVRNFEGDNDWLNSAYYQPALALILRNRPEDLQEAVRLLEELNIRNPMGPLHRHAAFWRARILEWQDDPEAARSLFSKIVEERPYDYYALRSRMHLQMGPAAAGRLWPDAQTREQIREGFEGSSSSEQLRGSSVYHQRLKGVLDLGLYSRAVEQRHDLRAAFPADRLQSIDLDLLDDRNAIPDTALLLAFRQDAWAAADSETRAKNHIELQAAVGLGAQDWPMAMSMAVGALHPHEGKEAIEQYPGFLRTAYPPAYEEAFLQASLAHQAPVALLYGVARRESLFDASALSMDGALGLFQFWPPNFDNLNAQWHLLAESDVDSKEEFLLNPTLNANLGSRWIVDELVFSQNCEALKDLGKRCSVENSQDRSLVLVAGEDWFADGLSTAQNRILLLALMEHSAGKGNVSRWKRRWQAQERTDDLEYMVETAGAGETRFLLRGVLTDVSIANAVELMPSEGG